MKAFGPVLLPEATIDTVVIAEGLVMPPFNIPAAVLQKAPIGVGHTMSYLAIQLTKILTLGIMSCACVSCNRVCVCVSV